MRILVWADAGAHTGFGTVTQNLMRRWAVNGWEMHILATNYLGDPWPGPWQLYPAVKYNRQDVFGLGRLKELLDRIKPDVFFILQDLYTVAEGLQTLGGQFPFPTVLYAPIDGRPLPRVWREATKAPMQTVAMTMWGQRVLREEAGLDVPVIWHGVEHEMLYPVSAQRKIIVNQGTERRELTTKEECKAALGVPGRFLIGAINRNSIRKNYPDTVRVFDQFRKAHPDAFLYIHAVQRDEGGDLAVLLDRYGLTREHVWVHSAGDTFVGSPKAVLTWLYNAFDVKLSMSMAEGFGLTDAEALACGTPVVAQDYSATTEVVGPGGILVPPARHFTTARMVDFMLPDLDATYEALERLYQDAALRAELGQKGVAHAKQFDWDDAARRFGEVFADVASRGSSAVPPARSVTG